MVSQQQRFNPPLLAGLVLGGKLVCAQAWFAEHQRESKLLLRLAQLHGATLQNDDAQDVALALTLLVEEQVPLQDAPTFLIGCVHLSLGKERVNGYCS